MKDCLSQRMQLVPTVHTRIAFATRNPVELSVYYTALRTCSYITISVLKYSIKTYVIVWKIFVKLCNCVSHITSKYMQQNTCCQG